MKIALIQMTSGPSMTENLTFLTSQIREAAGQGAVFIATPENSDFMVEGKGRKIVETATEDNHIFLPACSALAKELNVTILLGSVAVKISETKINNRSYLFSPQGEITAKYDKIHLFDADLPTGESRRESDMVEGGQKVVVAETGFGTLGLTICYDVRFPYLFRGLALKGADILAVPAAFTVPTGALHWDVLLRARAIENGAFVIAPAQCGTHDGGRKTYGHSLVVDPWGKVIAEAGESPGVLYAEIDLKEIARFRQAIPSLKHGKESLISL